VFAVELELLAESSFFEHEMIVRLKNNINEKFKIMFIFLLFSNERKRMENIHLMGANYFFV